jgi:hypothetical protein
MHFEGSFASGSEEICDLFAEFIQRTYADDVWVPSDPVPEHVPDDPPFGTLQFTSDEVESVLQDLDVNKGFGPDGMLPIILKNCAPVFAKPLSLLFNRYMVIATNVFPDRWTSFVLNSIENYNQVDSIYTDFSKAFDRVRHQLMLNEMSSPQDACGWDPICRGESRK